MRRLKHEFLQSRFPGPLRRTPFFGGGCAYQGGEYERISWIRSLGLVSGNLNLEGPIWKDRTSFNIALRRTWLDVLTAPVLAIVNKKNKKNGERINVRYAFHDLNARIDHRFSDRSRMYLSLYNGNDVLKVGSEDFAYSEYTSEYRNTIDAYMRWGNLVASAGWTYAFSNKLFGNCPVSIRDIVLKSDIKRKMFPVRKVIPDISILWTRRPM